MTREELLIEIETMYERAEVSSRPAVDYGINVTIVVFYLTALGTVRCDPFKSSWFNDIVLEVLEKKLDESFGALSPEEFDQVFRLSEELRVWESQYIPSARKAQ